MTRVHVSCKLIVVHLSEVYYQVLYLAAQNAALIGLALTYAVSLNGMFQYCVRQSAEVENLVRKRELY